MDKQRNQRRNKKPKEKEKKGFEPAKRSLASERGVPAIEEKKDKRTGSVAMCDKKSFRPEKLRLPISET